jgi:hypothetical protein
MTDIPIERMLDAVEWRPIPGAGGTDLHATHEGVLALADIELRCYVLSDGTRVFDADDIERFFGGDRV